MAGCSATGATSDIGSSIHYKDCEFEPQSHWPQVSCGVLTVPENYELPEGNTVQLPFMEFHPFEKRKGTAPLIVAGGGGPGGGYGISAEELADADDFLWILYSSSTVGNGRSLIITDNRGVGSATPRLDCKEVETAIIDGLKTVARGAAYRKLMANAFRECRSRLLSAGIDLSQYNVINAARDLDALRHHLGVEQVNLHGISYGTRVALVYDRLFPKHTRALVLDGVFPLSVRSYNDLIAIDEDSFNRLFSMCRKDAMCRERYGAELQSDFENFLRQLEEKPIRMTVTQDEPLAAVDVAVTPSVLTAAVFSALYDQYEIMRLPKILRAIISGGTDYLAELIRDQYLVNMTTWSLDEGAYASYACHDEIPFSDFDKAIKDAQKNPLLGHLNLDFLRFERELCDLWGVPAADEDLKLARAPNAPTLMLSGSMDPATPPRWAKALHARSRNTWHLEFDYIAHGIFTSTYCADEVTSQFLDAPLEDPGDASCLTIPATFSFEK